MVQLHARPASTAFLLHQEHFSRYRLQRQSRESRAQMACRSHSLRANLRTQVDDALRTRTLQQLCTTPRPLQNVMGDTFGLPQSICIACHQWQLWMCACVTSVPFESKLQLHVKKRNKGRSSQVVAYVACAYGLGKANNLQHEQKTFQLCNVSTLDSIGSTARRCALAFRSPSASNGIAEAHTMVLASTTAHNNFIIADFTTACDKTTYTALLHF